MHVQVTHDYIVLDEIVAQVSLANLAAHECKTKMKAKADNFSLLTLMVKNPLNKHLLTN